MLNFDPEEYLSIMNGAVEAGLEAGRVVVDQFESGATNLFYAGSGGIAYLTLPSARLLQTRSTLPTHVEMGAELVVRGNVNLGKDSVALFPSVSGTTPEAIEALEYSKQQGAFTVSLTAKADSPLGHAADVNVANLTADPTSSENFYLQYALIALAIQNARGEIDDYDAVVEEIKKMPEALRSVKEQFEERAAALAKEIKDEKHHIWTGAGSSWYEAWYYAMCILEEMQWISTRPVHASDFFHGTLELVEEDTSIFILKGEDDERPLTDRVERFAKTVTEKVRVIDSADFDLPGISDRVRALMSPTILAAALQRLSAHLEVERDHPLTTRRYYRRVEY